MGVVKIHRCISSPCTHHPHTILRLLSFTGIYQICKWASFSVTFLVYSCILLYTPVYYCILLHTTVHSCILLHTTVYYCILLHTTVYSCILLYTPAYSCILLHTPVYYCILLHTTVYLYTIYFVLLEEVVSSG